MKKRITFFLLLIGFVFSIFCCRPLFAAGCGQACASASECSGTTCPVCLQGVCSNCGAIGSQADCEIADTGASTNCTWASSTCSNNSNPFPSNDCGQACTTAANCAGTSCPVCQEGVCSDCTGIGNQTDCSSLDTGAVTYCGWTAGGCVNLAELPGGKWAIAVLLVLSAFAIIVIKKRRTFEKH